MPQQYADKVGRTLLSERIPPRDAEEFTLQDGIDDSLSIRARLIELETEHFHLQRLVTELLVKNQKLREMLCDTVGSSTSAHSTPDRHDASVGEPSGYMAIGNSL
jgi:hypothetical protein